jgi:hypothetical protein
MDYFPRRDKKLNFGVSLLGPFPLFLSICISHKQGVLRVSPMLCFPTCK